MGVNANVETTIYLPDTPKRVKAALVLHTSSGLKEADHIHQGFFEVPVSRTSGYAKGHDTCCDQDCAKKANPPAFSMVSAYVPGTVTRSAKSVRIGSRG